MDRTTAIHAALALALAGPSAANQVFEVAMPAATTPASAPRRANSHRATSHAARSSAPKSLSARKASIANAGPPKRRKDRRSGSSGKLRVLHLERLLRVSKARLLVAVSTLLTISSLAIAGSWAAWTAADTNGSNSFATDTILLADNKGGEAGSATNVGVAMFSVANLNPGSATTTGCIEVDITGTSPALTLGMSLAGDTGGGTHLDNQLTVVTAVYRNAAGSAFTLGSDQNTNVGGAAPCTNYPAGGADVNIADGAASNWAGRTLASVSAAAAGTIASPVTHTWYKFGISGLPAGDTACATYCSKTINITFTWTLTAT